MLPLEMVSGHSRRETSAQLG